uniref:Seipin n=1 Tax=Romanomermis culicivorax TaxID=13658 RepID=A0A915J3H0_ROMCU
MFLFFRWLRNLAGKFSLISSLKNVLLLWMNGFSILIFSLFVTIFLRSILLPNNVDFELPLHFLFRSCEFSPNMNTDYNRFGVICSYLESNISMKNEELDQFLLEKGVSYNLDAEITFPDSEANRDAGGMFLLVVNFLDENSTNQRQLRRSSALPYSSGLIRRLKKWLFLPFYLTNIWPETVNILLKLCPDLIFSHGEPEIWFLKIEFRHIFLQILGAKLKFKANLRGFTYFLYYWPWTTSILVFLLGIFCSSFLSIFYWSTKILEFLCQIYKVENLKMEISPHKPEIYTKRRIKRQIFNVGRESETLFFNERDSTPGSWFEPKNNLLTRRS